MEKLTRGYVEFSYGLPLIFEQLFNVKKVEFYLINGVHQIHNKSEDSTPNNNKMHNICLSKILIRMINQSVYMTELDSSHLGLHLSLSCTSYTAYINSYLRILN